MKLHNAWKDYIGSEKINQLRSSHQTENLVIGGGVAGLNTALSLVNKGKKVILLEKEICGGSSSGKSSGFLTPDSEIELYQLIRRYGLSKAKKVWKMPTMGVSLISKAIKDNKISCQLEKQDCMFLGIGNEGVEDVNAEAIAHKKMGLPYKVYEKEELKKILSSDKYSAGIRTFDTYSINSLMYCREIRKLLLKKGVQIFEKSPVIYLNAEEAITEKGSIKTKNLFLCIDKFKPALSKLSKKIYHAQTYLAITKPLSKIEIKSIMPKNKLMCWDSKLVYSYFKITPDNRLLLGGSSPIVTYSPWAIKSPFIIKRVVKEFKDNFPQLKHIDFEFYWPGLIDIAKDLMPIVGRDKNLKNIYYSIGNPGLPWAAFSGNLIAEMSLNKNSKETQEFSKYLEADRRFFISDNLQRIMGKIPSFAINNYYSKYNQIDI